MSTVSESQSQAQALPSLKRKNTTLEIDQELFDEYTPTDDEMLAAMGDEPCAKKAKVESKGLTIEVDGQESTAVIPMPQAAAAASTSTALTFIDISDPNSDEDGCPVTEKCVEQFLVSVKSAQIVNNRNIPIGNADLAMYLWCRRAQLNLHLFEFSGFFDTLLLKKKEGTSRDDKGNSTGSGKFYINNWTKKRQVFPGVKLTYQKHLYFLTPFFSPAFLKWGNSVESGIEGTRGKVVKGNPTPDQQSQYQFNCTNQVFTSMQSDSDTNNPIMTHFISEWNKMCDTLLLKACSQDGCLSELRAINKKTKTKAETPEQLAEWIKETGNFKTIQAEDEADPSSKRVGMAVSVFRKPVTWGEDAEDLSGYHAPSPLFQLCNQDKNGNLQIHNEIPLFRMRRPDEIVAGERYDSPLIRIPSHQSRLTNQDVIATVFTVGFYEWQFDKCGITNKPIAFVWLNTKDGLAALNRNSITPCDPMVANPYAGHYNY